MIKAIVHVKLKQGVLDPAGKAIAHSLVALGFDDVVDVRQGKFFEIELAEDDLERARQSVDAMCQRLIANPVIEVFSVELAT